jgi:hypothetical protein
MDGLWSTLHVSAPAAFVRESVWAYPALETLHVVGLALVFGSILAFDLRLLGWHRDLPVSRLGEKLLPWVWAGFALNAVSGVLLFASDAVEFAANTSFRVKMALLLLAGLNALWFQLRVARTLPAWDRGTMPPATARVAGSLSIALWLAIITAGRMMAYVK